MAGPHRISDLSEESLRECWNQGRKELAALGADTKQAAKFVEDAVVKVLEKEHEVLECQAQALLDCGYKLEDLTIVCYPGGSKEVLPKKYLKTESVVSMTPEQVKAACLSAAKAINAATDCTCDAQPGQHHYSTCNLFDVFVDATIIEYVDNKFVCKVDNPKEYQVDPYWAAKEINGNISCTSVSGTKIRLHIKAGKATFEWPDKMDADPHKQDWETLKTPTGNVLTTTIISPPIDPEGDDEDEDEPEDDGKRSWRDRAPLF